MIHVNPFDTGFDENSHVMKFSAVARDIITTTHAPPKFVVRRPELPPSSFSAPTLSSEASSTTARPAIPREMLDPPLSIKIQPKVVLEAPVVEVPAVEERERVEEGGLLSVVGAAVSPRESEVERAVVDEELMAAVEGESFVPVCFNSGGRERTRSSRRKDSRSVFPFSQRRKRRTTKMSLMLWLSICSML